MNVSSTPSPRPRSWAWAAGSAVAALSVLSAIFALHGGGADVPLDGASLLPPVSVAAVAEGDVSAWNEFLDRLTAVERVQEQSVLARSGLLGL